MRVSLPICFTALVAILVVAFASVAYAAPDGWKDDFDAAVKEAKESGKHVLVDFTGSDWCGWCIRLTDEVFSKSAFKEFAKDKLILVKVDFPRGKEVPAEVMERNRELAQKYGVRGFPTIVLLDPEGEEVARTGYRRGGAEAYVKHLEDLLASN
ncbi:MAG: thioredoxin family protein [Opitutales bacterium]|nr:thioredoxin family protein [Opitutales bacterium]